MNPTTTAIATGSGTLTAVGVQEEGIDIMSPYIDILSPYRGIGYVVQSAPDLPVDILHDSLKSKWSVLVWDKNDTAGQVEKNIAYYSVIGPVVLLCRTVAQVRFARANWKVLAIYRNEPDQVTEDLMDPEELGIIVKQLVSESPSLNPIGAPNVSTFKASDYLDRFYREMRDDYPKDYVPCMHGYGVPFANLPKTFLYTELNPESYDPKVKAKFVMDVRASGLAAAIFQAPSTHNGSEEDGFLDWNAGKWQLNSAGKALTAMVKAAL